MNVTLARENLEIMARAFASDPEKLGGLLRAAETYAAAKKVARDRRDRWKAKTRADGKVPWPTKT